MAVNLKGRNFLTLIDFTPEEIRYMLDLAHDLKAKKLSLIHIYIGDIIVGGVLLVIVAAIVIKMIRDKKAGKSACGCGSCLLYTSRCV